MYKLKAGPPTLGNSSCHEQCISVFIYTCLVINSYSIKKKKERKSSNASFDLKCLKRKLIRSLVSVSDAKTVELLQRDHVENAMSKMCVFARTCSELHTLGETAKNSSRSCVYLQCDTNTQQNTHTHTERLSRVLWKLAGRCEGRT